jgi:hypothetical protein
MARPLKINNTTPKSLKEMSDAEIDYLSYVILTDFASTETGTGTLNATSGTSIGTITDTERPDAIGTHPVGTTVNETDFTLYQNLTAVSPSGATRPLKVDQGTSPASMKEMTDSEITTTIIAQTAAQMVSGDIGGGDIGSYRLSTSIPYSGTWTSTGITFVDQSQDGDITYTLYRKTNGTLITPVRSIKSNAGSLKEMSDPEIETLTQYLRKYIVDTGIGQYSLSSSAPATGTWVGINTITDTRQQLGDVNYAGTVDYLGNYVGNFTANYVGNFTNNVHVNYQRTSTRTSTRTRAATYTGNFAGNFAGNFILYYEGSIRATYTRTSARTRATNYVGDFTGNFAGNFLGDYIGNFTNTYTSNFTTNRATDYVGNYINTAVNFAGQTVLASKETASTVQLWIRTA